VNTVSCRRIPLHAVYFADRSGTSREAGVADIVDFISAIASISRLAGSA
jgi:hypothetical protein